MRKLPSNRFQASYWHDGKRHAAADTFKTKADALAFLSKTEADLLRGGWVDPAAGAITVSALADEWLTSNARKRSSTRQRDETILRLHVLPHLGARRVSSVTPALVQQLVDAWAAEHAASTVVRQHAVLSAMFSFAVDSDRIARTPCRRIRLPQVRQTPRPELSPDDLERLASELGPDQATMMWTAAVLGARFAEAAGLTVDRIDMLGGRVTVDRQLLRDGKLSDPKTGAGIRTVAVPAWLLEELAGVLARRGLTAADGDTLVFSSPTGQPLHYTNWRRRVWVPGCERAGLAGLNFHDLRALSATALVATGADVKTAQRRLGHASARVTLDLYARATAAADREAADRVGAYLRPSIAHAARTERAGAKKAGR